MRSVDKDTVINVFMGLSRSSIYKIAREKKEKGRVASPPPKLPKNTIIDALDDLDLRGIRRKIYGFYFENELPTIDKILSAVNADDSLPNFKRTTFYKVLKKNTS